MRRQTKTGPARLSTQGKAEENPPKSLLFRVSAVFSLKNGHFWRPKGRFWPFWAGNGSPEPRNACPFPGTDEPNLGSNRPSPGTDEPNLGSCRAKLGSNEPFPGTRRPNLDSARPNPGTAGWFPGTARAARGVLE
jgi:hypothetical protein